MTPIRWAAAVPCGILAMILVNIFIGVAIFVTTRVVCHSWIGWLPGSSHLCYLPASLGLYALALVNPLVLVLSGSLIAPSNRFYVSIGLAVLASIAFVALSMSDFSANLLSNIDYFASYSYVRWYFPVVIMAFNIVGALAGIFAVRAIAPDGP